MPNHDARNGPPGVLFRNDGHGRFVDVTARTGLEAGNDRYHFAAAWADYDEDGWPDLLVANDFGTKNLYRNLARSGGTVRFEDVAEQAGVLDGGAGMARPSSLRQRRRPRHLHRQQWRRARPARHRVAGLHA